MTVHEEQLVKTEVENLDQLSDIVAMEQQNQQAEQQQLPTAIMQQLTPVGEFFNGRSVFVTGASGFIGRVLLEKLLRCYPGIKRIYILLRSKKNLTPYERLHKHLLKVPIFNELRAQDVAAPMNDATRADDDAVADDTTPKRASIFDKITVISGDIGEDDLGISNEDRQTLLNDPTLAIVFHSAASVKFDEPLKQSIKYNLLATKKIIELCRQMKHLVSLCHVSTAYVNSNLRNNQDIEECLYPMEQDPSRVIKLAELLDEDMLQMMKPKLVGDRPNTYTYTKSLAEHLYALEASDLPVAIVRPSIVVAAWKEPLKGWIENLNGPTGLVLAIGKGLLRTLYAVRSCKADIIPVDICVNTMIAAAYYTSLKSKTINLAASGENRNENANNNINNNNNNNSNHSDKANNNIGPIAKNLLKKLPPMTNKTISQNNDNDVDRVDSKTQTGTNIQEDQQLQKSYQPPPVFQCTSGDKNPITWGQMEDMFWPIILRYPSQQVLRYPSGTFKGNRYFDLFMRMFVHFLPALIIDLLCFITGKKRQLLMIYDKLHRATDALENFCTTNYNFKSTNLALLETSLLHPKDKENLYMDISTLDWYEFWDYYVLGARRYVLREQDDTLPEARKNFQRARYIEYSLRMLLFALVAACMYPLARPAIHTIITTLGEITA